MYLKSPRRRREKFYIAKIIVSPRLFREDAGIPKAIPVVRTCVGELAASQNILVYLKSPRRRRENIYIAEIIVSPRLFREDAGISKAISVVRP